MKKIILAALVLALLAGAYKVIREKYDMNQVIGLVETYGLVIPSNEYVDLKAQTGWFGEGVRYLVLDKTDDVEKQIDLFVGDQVSAFRVRDDYFDRSLVAQDEDLEGYLTADLEYIEVNDSGNDKFMIIKTDQHVLYVFIR